MIRIPPNTLLLPQLPGTTREPFALTLKLGQILEARVLSENLGNQVQLLIGGNKLIAQTPLRVTPGQSLSLQVDQTSPLPVLKLLSLTDPQQLQTEALKRILPKQRPLSELFDKLSQIQSSSSLSTHPGQIKQAMQTMFERLLSVSHPQFRQSIKTALFDSGLFMESNLVNQESRSNDLKLNMLRLYDLVKSLLPPPDLTQDRKMAPSPEQDPTAMRSQTVLKQLTDLLKQLDGAIARIHTNQLASLPAEDPTRQVWQFELPLMCQDQVDLYQITIKQESSGPREDPDSIWSVTLQMNLQPLGPMRVQLRLQGKSLATVIWAERPGTMQLLERHLPRLQQAFEQADLEVTRLQAYQTKIAASELVPPVSGLLSEKA